jgi:hypothetical protein
MNPTAAIESAQLPVACQSPNTDILRCGSGTLVARWDGEGQITRLAGVVPFAEFLRETGFLDPLLRGSPLRYSSPNAPSPADVMGTLLVAVLDGMVRYSHINELRRDAVCPEALGFRRIVSEDSVRRALLQTHAGEEAWQAWLDRIQMRILLPLLERDWVMDADNTVKCLYGRQEGAEKGYNPKKPGRPSHNYQTFLVGRLRLVAGVSVLPGKRHAGLHGAAEAFGFLRKLPRGCWPRFVRGDVGYGTSAIMDEAERLGLRYLFKLARTRRMRQRFLRLCARGDWTDAGQGWQGLFEMVRLEGWSHVRRCLFLRRPARRKPDGAPAGPEPDDPARQLLLPTAEDWLPPASGPADPSRAWDFCVLVTDLPGDDPVALSQLYRDRGDCENVFDELKAQWGWGGFTTRDLPRNRVVARYVGAVYNLWSLYARLGSPDAHREAKTSRPVLLHILGRVVHSGRRTILHLVSTHALADRIAAFLAQVHEVLTRLKATAEQLGPDAVWILVLGVVFRRHLRPTSLAPPPGLPGQQIFAFP